MAMMGHKHAKNQSNQKSSAGPNSSFSKKSVGRPKSACKGKADIFNSTAPIKFFSNFEETVKDITALNGVNIKLRSSKERSTKQARLKEYGSIEERKIGKGGTQQIDVQNI